MNILNGYNDYKILPNPIMSKYRNNNNYEWLMHLVEKSWTPLIYKYEQDPTDPLSYCQSSVKNPDWIPLERGSKMLAFQEKYYEWVKVTNFNYPFNEERWKVKHTEEWRHNPDYDEIIWKRHFTKLELQKYLNVVPLGKWVMINISPNWKGEQITQHKVDTFKKVIENYLNEGWYSGMGSSYCIESGGSADMLHAHLVLRYDNSPKTMKSAKSHLAKGNHSQQLNKWWNKEFDPKGSKGYKGLVKGKYAIQKIFLNTDELIRDKLSYLVEDLKPDGHKNMDIKGIKGLNTKIEWEG